MVESNRSMDSLTESLDSEEELLHYVRATMVQNPLPREQRGSLAVTTKRVLFKEHSWHGGLTSLQWPWDWLRGVSSKKALKFEHIKVKSPGGTVKFLVDYGEADLFILKVKEALDGKA